MIDAPPLTHSILSMKPAVTRSEAARALAEGVTGAVRCWRLGRLRLLADIYVPFWVFEVKISTGRARGSQTIALDAISGRLDLYRFDGVPKPERLMSVQTRNRLEPRLGAVEAEQAVRARMERLLFARIGFFRLSELRIEVAPLMHDLHFPYWVGFFGGGDLARIAVIDGLRGTIEGPKVRHLLHRELTGAHSGIHAPAPDPPSLEAAMTAKRLDSERAGARQGAVRLDGARANVNLIDASTRSSNSHIF